MRFSGRAARALTGAGLVTAAYGANAVVRIALVPVLTRTLPVEVFSAFMLLNVAAPALLVLSDLGCGAALVRELAAEEDPAHRPGLIATALGGRVILGVLVSLAVIAGSAFAEPEMAAALRLGAGALFCFGLSMTAREALLGAERYGAAALSQVANSLPPIAALASWIVFGNRSLSGLIAAILAGALVELVTTLALLARGGAVAGRPSLVLYRKFLGFGVPVAVYFGLRSAGTFDRHIVGYRTTLEQAGLFQLASAPAGGIDLIEMAGVSVAEPYVYGVEEGERPRALESIARLFAFAFLAAAAVLGFAAPELLAVLAPNAYGPALAALPGLTFAAAGRSMGRVIGLGAGIARQTRVFAFAGAAHVAVTLVAIALVVPSLGLAGAASIHVVTSAMGLSLTYALTRRSWEGAEVLGRTVTVTALLLLAGGALAMAFASDAFGLLAPAWVRGASAIAFIGLGGALLLRPTRRRKHRA